MLCVCTCVCGKLAFQFRQSHIEFIANFAAMLICKADICVPIRRTVYVRCKCTFSIVIHYNVAIWLVEQSGSVTEVFEHTHTRHKYLCSYIYYIRYDDIRIFELKGNTNNAHKYVLEGSHFNNKSDKVRELSCTLNHASADWVKFSRVRGSALFVLISSYFNFCFFLPISSEQSSFMHVIIMILCKLGVAKLLANKYD